MNIDVFTFVAQIFNFALLVWLLRRFLYKPIREAMQKREQTIAERLEQARQEHATAEGLAEEYRNRLRDVDEEADEMLAEARTDADGLAARLGEELRERMTVRERDWRENLARKTEEELRGFRADVRREITEALRTAFADLADTELEERMISAFLERLKKLDEDEIVRLVGPDDDHAVLEIVTSASLNDARREDVERGIRSVFGDDVRLKYSVDAERLAGIELRCHGHRLGWNLGDYVETLDDAVRRELDAITRGAATPHAAERDETAEDARSDEAVPANESSGEADVERASG